MTVYFKWLDEYSINVAEIDEQHRYIFRLANQIQFAKLSDAEKYAKNLFDYTKWHFRDEEKYFAELKSPLLVDHMQMHNHLLNELNTMVAKGFSTDDDLERLKAFYLKWLVDHILYQDRKVIRLHQEEQS